MNTYATYGKLLKAMAHPTRVRILEVLSHGEACVCHLTTLLDQRQPYISQHLMVLREAGLVTDERDGLQVYYRLAGERIADLVDLGFEILCDLGLETERKPVLSPPLGGCSCPICESPAESQKERLTDQ